MIESCLSLRNCSRSSLGNFS